MSETPSGFEPLFRTSPFLDVLGPIYNRRTGTVLLIGFHAQHKHCNARGVFSVVQRPS